MGDVVPLFEGRVNAIRSEYERLLDIACKLDEQGHKEARMLVLNKVKELRIKLDRITKPRLHVVDSFNIFVDPSETIDYLKLNISIFPKDL